MPTSGGAIRWTWRWISWPAVWTRKKALLFRQSDVPEVTELAWMLTTLTPMGLLERCHSYKDKIAHGISPNHGVFAYPVLMAADILIYDSNVVPGGRDQKQHVEVTRDIAIKFNETYGQTFILPEPRIRDETASVPGSDGQKMSKSYGNTIEIFGEEKALRKKVMGLVMDSRTPQEPKPDAEKTSPSNCCAWSRRRAWPRITRTDCARAVWAMAI
jgi:tryptophanyl-tRNA synthetase